MRIYQIYIKSHTDAPDYEDSCSAEDLKEASRIFAERIARNSDEDWGAGELEQFIEEP